MSLIRFAAALAFAAAHALPAVAEVAAPPRRALTPVAGDLAIAYSCEVNMRLDVPEDAVAAYAALLERALASAGAAPLAPQHVLLVDRNPHVQAALLFRLLPGGTEWRLAGASPVSTGLPGTFEHFETPLGVFAKSLDNLDFRAEGTPNENGILGYGKRGLRVFDFGWVPAPRGWGDHAPGVMRLQVATDPASLEPWLGAPRSKGCIRIPATLDTFLDRHGVLDADYELALSRGETFWVLRHDRLGTRWPGRYLVVVDSGRTQRPAWSPAPDGRARRSPLAPDCPSSTP